LDKVKAEIGKVIVGQENMIEHLLAALLSNGTF
jgi:MoxR-like ATPase